MRAGETWLRERLATAPPALVRAMVESLPEEAPDVSEALLLGAASLYRTVAGGGGSREDALPLLAADALLTHAFHARAEHDPADLLRLARQAGAQGMLREIGVATRGAADSQPTGKREET